MLSLKNFYSVDMSQYRAMFQGKNWFNPRNTVSYENAT